MRRYRDPSDPVVAQTIRTAPAATGAGAAAETGSAGATDGATAGDLRTTVEHGQIPNGGRTFTRTLHANDRGMAMLAQWIAPRVVAPGRREVPREAHGPNASREMLRFFLDHPHAAPRA